MTTWSANRLAAKAVVLNVADRAEARELLDMIGLVDGGRLLPDDTRNYDTQGAAPVKTVPSEAPGVRDLHPENCTTPPGLRDLPPVEPARLRPRKPKTKASPKRSRARKGRRIPECGTPSGARRHQRLGEPICTPCLESRRTAGRAVWRKAHPPPPGRERPPCGTRGGYESHLWRGEPTCQLCRLASAERQREQYRKQAAEKGRVTVSYKGAAMRAKALREAAESVDGIAS